MSPVFFVLSRVLVEVDVTGDRVLFDVAEVDVLADRVIGVRVIAPEALSLVPSGSVGLGQLDDVAGLGDLDRVGSGVEAGEGVSCRPRRSSSVATTLPSAPSSSTVMSLKGSSPLSNEEDSLAS